MVAMPNLYLQLLLIGNLVWVNTAFNGKHGNLYKLVPKFNFIDMTSMGGKVVAESTVFHFNPAVFK